MLGLNKQTNKHALYMGCCPNKNMHLLRKKLAKAFDSLHGLALVGGQRRPFKYKTK